MGRTRRSFTKEFKREAVRFITDGGQTLAQVARDLGIRDTILGR
jgi:transposase